MFPVLFTVLVAVAMSVADQGPLQCYEHIVRSFSKDPVVAWSGLPGGTGAFAQLYNPSWIAPTSSGTAGRAGLVLRSQNCALALKIQRGGCRHFRSIYESDSMV